MKSPNFGYKRITTGAHYGARDWLVQRLSALLMALYFVILLIVLLLNPSAAENAWVGAFQPQWFKLLSMLFVLTLVYHAWIGVRDIWMDYVHIFYLRVVLHALTLCWLALCVIWAAQILWSV